MIWFGAKRSFPFTEKALKRNLYAVPVAISDSLSEDKSNASKRSVPEINIRISDRNHFAQIFQLVRV